MPQKAGTARNNFFAVPADKEEEKDAQEIYLF